MFVGHDVRLDVSFAVACERFARLISDGWLIDASDRAYADGLSGLIRVGPFGAVLGASKLVRVQTLDPVHRDDSVALPLRWEATGTMGRLFPVFDADLVLTPAGPEATCIELRGAYRAPLGGIGSAVDRIVLHRAAPAPVPSLLPAVPASIPAPAAQPTALASKDNGIAPPPRVYPEPGTSL